jgi:small-conductance mechanosensitive channel
MVSSEVAERVRAVISAAEAAASALRHEAEQDAQMRRRATEEEARHYLEDARRDAEAFLRERQRRIAELSDEILERSEKILARLDRADEVKHQLQELVDALGETAAQIATGVGGGTARASRREPEPPAPEPEPAPPPVAEEPPIVETEPVPEPEEGEVEIVELPRTEEEEPVPAGRGADDDEDLAARLVALQMAVAGANRGEVEVHLRGNFTLDDPARILDDVFGRGSESDKRVTWPEAVRDTGS